MTVVAAMFGLLIAAIGALGVVSPQGLLAWLSRFQSLRGLYVIAGIRVTLGFVFLVAAPESRSPGFLFVFGALALAAGFLTPFFGVRRFEAIVGWWSRQSSLFVRVWCLGVFVLGLAILAAVRP